VGGRGRRQRRAGAVTLDNPARNGYNEKRRPSHRAALHRETSGTVREDKLVAGAQPFVVKRSRIEGRGAFATRRIRTNEKVGEYAGERITHEESDERYGDNQARTYLFIVDSKLVIDAEVDGNDVRFINHSCDPNCESRMDAKKRVYIHATRMIEEGEELAYDYRLQLNPGENLLEEISGFPCLCGSPKCRGTLLWVPYKQRKAAAAVLARANGKRQSIGRASKNGHKRAKSGRTARPATRVR
jgi:hypothetical protein